MEKHFKIWSWWIVLMVLTNPIIAQTDKHGDLTVIKPHTILNEFTALTRDAQSGSTSIKVMSSALNQHSRFTESLQSGDLVMVIQTQGAIMKTGVNGPTWGQVVDYSSSGNWEFQEVVQVLNKHTIKLASPLKNNYSVFGKTQVVRVPRLSSLTIATGSVLTTDPWNGVTGGVLSVEVSGITHIQDGGLINVTGLGFRGGSVENASSLNAVINWDSKNYASHSPFSGAEKGEGIGGNGALYQNYCGGKYGRGAPANGGGGGNGHNSGGGGGANVGNLEQWTGQGNPAISNPDWVQAWNLEEADFAFANSSGGGRGGYSFSWTKKNALENGPGTYLWKGDLRNNVGGLGGRPLDYFSGRLFLGGGGGAGDGNNRNNTNGGNGGGLIYILSYGSVYGTIFGLATIEANGMDAETTSIGPQTNGDGPGGGGGGGTIVLDVVGDVGGLTIKAIGGNGGNQVVKVWGEAEGPGGGGGGGYIATNNALASVVFEVFGGENGVTNAKAVKEFPPNGATRGGPGIITQITNYDQFKRMEVQRSHVINLESQRERFLSIDSLFQQKTTVLVPLQGIYYDLNRSALTQASFNYLNQLYELLSKKMSLELEVVTYSVAGLIDTNLLAESKASAIKRYLTSKGIKEKRIHYLSYKDSKYASHPDSIAQEPWNQGVELILKK